MTDPRPPRPDDDPGTDAPAITARLTVPPAPPSLVDAHVVAALAAFDEEHAGDGAGAGAAVSDLADRRGENPWYRRIPLGAVAAAAIIVALVGASQLVDDDQPAEETASELADEAAPGAQGADDSAAALETSEAAGGGSGTPDGRPVFGSTDELVAHLDETLTAATTARPSASGGGGTSSEEAPVAADSSAAAATGDCDPVSVAGVEPDAVELVEAVILDSRRVTAVVHGTGDDRRVVVVDDETCQVVEDRAF